jgi:hypothetical protein
MLKEVLLLDKAISSNRILADTRPWQTVRRGYRT